MADTPDEALTFTHATNAAELPPGVSVESLAQFLHDVMKPYHDAVPDVTRGIEYALSDAPGQGGFIHLVTREQELLGAVVILATGMSGYVPENMLLFVAVRPELRGQGIGGKLIKRALARCEGAVKLHVEPENPARRLYERLGFSSKYVEMRYVQP
jgi:ribosomal protein S18 acetylase RimI-like enzyme